MRPLSSALFPDGNGRMRHRLVEIQDDGSPGRPVALRGFNLSGAAKDPANRGRPFSLGLANDLVARAADFLPGLASDGFDLLRIPIVWEFFEQSLTAPAEMHALLAYAGALGFRVIVDIHQDLLGSYFRDDRDPARTATWHGDGFPLRVIQAAYGSKDVPREWNDEPLPGLPVWDQWAINYEHNVTLGRAMEGLARASADFERFATLLGETFGALDNVVTYEVMNEPYSKHLPPGVHLALAAAVRAGLGAVIVPGRTPTFSVMPAGDWLVHLDPFPTIATTTGAIRTRLSLPGGPLRAALGDGYWLITPHYYDPRAGTPPGTPWPLAAPEPSEYEATVRATETLIEEWEVVPIVGEFGVGSNKSERDRCHRAWLDAFEARGWSWCHWNFNPDAGPGGDDHWCGEKLSVAESTDVGVHPTDAYRALLRPFPRRYGGPLLSATWNGRTWRARIGPAFAPGWHTEVFVPSSLGSFRASGGEIQGRLVVVTTDAGAVDVAISVDSSSS